MPRRTLHIQVISRIFQSPEVKLQLNALCKQEVPLSHPCGSCEPLKTRTLIRHMQSKKCTVAPPCAPISKQTLNTIPVQIIPTTIENNLIFPLKWIPFPNYIFFAFAISYQLY